MKIIKFLICVLLCLSLSLTTLCGCFGDLFEDDFIVDLIDTTKKNEEAVAFETLEKDKKAEFVVSEMEKAFKSGKKTVEFQFDCSEYLFDAYQTICLENPQFFWLTRSSSYEITEKGVNATVIFMPKILLKDDEIKAMQKEIDAETQRFLAGISSEASDYQKVLYIHDYIVDNCFYDNDSADFVIKNPKKDLPQNVHNSTTIYGCLITRLGICSGYSATFKYLADKIGIECMRVSGNGKETGESHQWNCVKVDGEYYYIDATWDDKVHTDPGVYSKDYEYFLINEQELLLTHTIKEGQILPSCVSEKYNYYIYNGLYLEQYNFTNFSQIVRSKLPAKEISIKFGSAEECQKAFSNLFEGNKRFWDIRGIKSKTVKTSISESGEILNIEL